MLNQDLHLNEKVLNKDAEKKSLRDGFGEGLEKAGEENKNVVALCADLIDSTKNSHFKEKFPERFIEMGVAEQNMAAVAAGLGISGKIPFISSYAVFSPGRNWEQIRTTICYNNSNVKIAGHHTGLSTGPDGATHQALEDIAILRVLPNIKIFSPCDAIEAEKAVLAAINISGPVYIRLAKNPTPVITSYKTPFIPGKSDIFWEPKKKIKPQVLIISSGPIIYRALLAADKLEEEKISSVVLNLHTIKPADDKKIIQLAKNIGAVVTVEEHQIAGGIGSLVSEILSRSYPVPMEFVGVNDLFGQSGKEEELLDKYGLSVDDIKKAAKKVIKRK